MTNKEKKPGLPPANITQRLIAANQPVLDDFAFWIFHPGMLFSSIDKWWGDFGTREFPHEGIDLCLYEDRYGQTNRLGPETIVTVLYNGFVRATFKDYLGQAIIVEHESDDLPNGKFLSVYAHTKPLDGVKPGEQFNRGDAIATIADTHHSKAKILPHLHLSLAIPSPDLSYDNFVWNIMRDPDRITLQNPVNNIQAPYQVVDGNFG